VEFAPTWLYVKRHRQTGLKYFGKTVRDPMKYIGSGGYWKKHIKAHGRDVETVWCKLFIDQSSLVEFAELFSEFYNIVKETDRNGKKSWANEVPENGLHGGQNAGMPSPLKGKPTGRPSVWKNKKRPEQSNAMKGRKQTAEHSAKISASLKNHIRTTEHKTAISKAKKGVPNPKVSIALEGNPKLNSNKGKKLKTYKCRNCEVETTGGNLKRWHNENCRKIKENINVQII
jgi:hypothetical protein